jgi:hypothetical protein
MRAVCRDVLACLAAAPAQPAAITSAGPAHAFTPLDSQVWFLNTARAAVPLIVHLLLRGIIAAIVKGLACFKWVFIPLATSGCAFTCEKLLVPDMPANCATLWGIWSLFLVQMHVGRSQDCLNKE